MLYCPDLAPPLKTVQLCSMCSIQVSTLCAARCTQRREPFCPICNFRCQLKQMGQTGSCLCVHLAAQSVLTWIEHMLHSCTVFDSGPRSGQCDRSNRFIQIPLLPSAGSVSQACQGSITACQGSVNCMPGLCYCMPRGLLPYARGLILHARGLSLHARTRLLAIALKGGQWGSAGGLL